MIFPLFKPFIRIFSIVRVSPTPPAYRWTQFVFGFSGIFYPCVSTESSTFFCYIFTTECLGTQTRIGASSFIMLYFSRLSGIFFCFVKNQNFILIATFNTYFIEYIKYIVNLGCLLFPARLIENYISLIHHNKPCAVLHSIAKIVSYHNGC